MIHIGLLDIHGCAETVVMIGGRDLTEKYYEVFFNKEIGICDKMYYRGQILTTCLYGDSIRIYSQEDMIKFLRDIYDEVSYECQKSIDTFINTSSSSIKDYTIVVYVD